VGRACMMSWWCQRISLDWKKRSLKQLYSISVRDLAGKSACCLQKILVQTFWVLVNKSGLDRKKYPRDQRMPWFHIQYFRCVIVARHPNFRHVLFCDCTPFLSRPVNCNYNNPFKFVFGTIPKPLYSRDF